MKPYLARERVCVLYHKMKFVIFYIFNVLRIKQNGGIPEFLLYI